MWIFSIENEQFYRKWHTQGVLHSVSIKNNFNDKTDLRLFYFHITRYDICAGI